MITTTEGREELRRHERVWTWGEMRAALDLLDRQEKGLDIAEEIVRLNRILDGLMECVFLLEWHRWKAAAHDALDAALAKWDTWAGN